MADNTTTSGYSNSILDGLNSIIDIGGKGLDYLSSFKERSAAVDMQKADLAAQQTAPTIDTGSIYEGIKNYGLTFAFVAVAGIGVWYLIKKV